MPFWNESSLNPQIAEDIQADSQFRYGEMEDMGVIVSRNCSNIFQ
jgi:hypothetical protein